MEVWQGNPQIKRCIKDIKRVVPDRGGCGRGPREGTETQSGWRWALRAQLPSGSPEQSRSPRISDDPRQRRGEKRKSMQEYRRLLLSSAWFSYIFWICHNRQAFILQFKK